MLSRIYNKLFRYVNYPDLESSQYWSLEKQYQFQRKRFLKIFKYHYDNNFAYRTFCSDRGLKRAIDDFKDIKKIPIITKDDLLSFQNLVMNVPISDNVINYAVNFVHSTRPSKNSPDITNKYIQWGAGPRASSYLILAAKAKAILNGKATPDIDDVKSVIKSVLRHRINMNFNAEAEGIKIDSLLEQLMD